MEWISRVVLLDEFEILSEGNASAFVSVDLVEVPLHHFFTDGDIQRFEGILHQLSELLDVNELVFSFSFSFLFILNL